MKNRWVHEADLAPLREPLPIFVGRMCECDEGREREEAHQSVRVDVVGRRRAHPNFGDASLCCLNPVVPQRLGADHERPVAWLPPFAHRQRFGASMHPVHLVLLRAVLHNRLADETVGLGRCRLDARLGPAVARVRVVRTPTACGCRKVTVAPRVVMQIDKISHAVCLDHIIDLKVKDQGSKTAKERVCKS
eukprot:6173595-Pleurochrysis_carterae.AAC.4